MRQLLFDVSELGVELILFVSVGCMERCVGVCHNLIVVLSITIKSYAKEKGAFLIALTKAANHGTSHR